MVKQFILVIVTIFVLLVYLASYAVYMPDWERCIIEYGTLAYFAVVMWKLIMFNDTE